MSHYEIEMKARVNEPSIVEKRLNDFAEFSSDFCKNDEYWLCEKINENKWHENFRLRTNGNSATVTFKKRSNKDGLEVNIESEFDVSDPIVFRVFADMVSKTKYLSKTKIGKAWSYKDFNIELCKVNDLGWFLEIERLISNADKNIIEQTKNEILELLKKALGENFNIEIRSYSEMILNSKPTKANQ